MDEQGFTPNVTPPVGLASDALVNSFTAPEPLSTAMIIIEFCDRVGNTIHVRCPSDSSLSAISSLVPLVILPAASDY